MFKLLTISCLFVALACAQVPSKAPPRLPQRVPRAVRPSPAAKPILRIARAVRPSPAAKPILRIARTVRPKLSPKRPRSAIATPTTTTLGSPATVDKFPYIVSIKTTDDQHPCAGTVVTSRFIVSAVHCLVDQTTDTVSVQIDPLDGKGTTTTVRVDTIITHPTLDISVIRTTTEIPDFAKRQINLATRAPTDKDEVTVSGYGLTYHKPGETFVFTSELRFFDTQISEAECKSTDTICTISPKPTGTCMANCGGPVVNTANELIGVMSGGTECTTADQSTNVFNQAEWIRTTITANTPKN